MPKINNLDMNKAFGSILLISLLMSFYIYPAAAFSEDELAPGPGPEPEPESEPPLQSFDPDNPRLKRAFTALQALKKTIKSDPFNTTKNWVGPDVCLYTGVTCAPALDDPSTSVVAGLDLNKADIAAHLPPEIELLEELAFLHINSNRFCGTVPEGISKLPLLFELDISNNRFVGSFPKAVLNMVGLKYLDLRYNNFEGPLPPKLFEMELDAIFVNSNRFSGSIPDTLGKSTVSVVVFAHNNLSGCIPMSIGNMTQLEQVIFSHNNLTGCLPEEMGRLASLDALDLSNNNFKGDVPDSICELPRLMNFSFADNYFVKAGSYCYSSTKDMGVNDTANCIQGLPDQKPEFMCSLAVDANGAIDCTQCRATHDLVDRSLSPPMPFYESSQAQAPVQTQFAALPMSVSLAPVPSHQPRKLSRPAYEDVRSLHTFGIF